jgi:hypothetical protein
MLEGATIAGTEITGAQLASLVERFRGLGITASFEYYTVDASGNALSESSFVPED